MGENKKFQSDSANQKIFGQSKTSLKA